ncbi:hypothetical protein FRC10_004710 [Ceratobasidium sp. 414]|nr:hypothetical protein FRC10_004710 [Ceratobasidium sp. 414]
MAHLKDMKPDPAPDYGALFKDIRPTPKPIVGLDHIPNAARMVGETVEIVALELSVTGYLIFQALLLTAFDLLFASVVFLFGPLHFLASYFRGVFKIVGRMAGQLLSTFIWCIGGTYKLSSATLNILWLVILRRILDVMYGNARLWCGFKEYAKLQEWESSQDDHTRRGGLCSDWFAEHPGPSEALPTSTSRRQWKFSYSRKRSVVGLLTPPITPPRKAKPESGQR